MVASLKNWLQNRTPQLIGMMDTEILEEAPLTPTFKTIYARYIFRDLHKAHEFAELIVEHDWTVSVAYASERAHWQATVRRKIHPVFRDITIWLATLTARVTPLSGERDGWGYEPQT